MIDDKIKMMLPSDKFKKDVLYAVTTDIMVGATEGHWDYNCAGEIFATVNGDEVRIGHFQGCEADARAVCHLMNKYRSGALQTS